MRRARLHIGIAIMMALFIVPITTSAQTSGTQPPPTNQSATGNNNLSNTAQNLQSSAAASYQFQNEGIFGCNQTAGINSSAGVMVGSGIFVPVNDAAVTTNTGILVYKECVLRPLQDRLRESAMSALLKKNVTGILTGRQGNKQFVVDPGPELLAVQDKSRLTTYTNGTINAAPSIYQAAVRTSNARTYRQNSRAPDSILTCPYQGDLQAADAGTTNDPIGGVLRMMYPSCYALGSAELFEDLAAANDATALDYQRMMWNWGRGFYAITDNAASPLQEQTLTPASVVQESFQQILGSPVRQLESANDIGQMIGALFAGVTTQITTDNRGLAGITQSSGGQPSYLDQIAKESSQGVIGAAVNAALTILNGSRQVEAAYLASMNAIAASLKAAIDQLRATENQCWALIVPKVRDYAAQQNCSTDASGNTTCTGGQALDETKISISTSSQAFSQQVIDSQVTPLANIAIQNVKSSQNALGLIDQLIAGVTNTASLDAQRISLQQLDNLVAQKLLHTQYDAQNAAQQQKDVAVSMSNSSEGGLVYDTAHAWGDSTDPSIGWCNINNPTVVQMWADRWKK